MTIDWLVSKHGTDQVIEFRWQEVGGPTVTGRPSRNGFGTRLIEKVLAAELEGEGKIEYLSAGLVFTIEAPLPDQDKISGTPDEEIFRRNIGSFVD